MDISIDGLQKLIGKTLLVEIDYLSMPKEIAEARRKFALDLDYGYLSFPPQIKELRILDVHKIYVKIEEVDGKRPRNVYWLKWKPENLKVIGTLNNQERQSGAKASGR